MSIIYDALKKVENSRMVESKAQAEKKNKPKPKPYLVYIFLICLGLFMINLFFHLPITKKPPKAVVSAPIKKEPPIPVQVKEPVLPDAASVKESPATFVLNGVFFSGNEGYALVNNRIVRRGDKIDGAVVTEILLDGVKLERDSSVIELSSSTK